MILMWSCPCNMPKYYPGLRDILPGSMRVYRVIAFLLLVTNLIANQMCEN